jgi:sugar phosphate isomerase/epimerase
MTDHTSRRDFVKGLAVLGAGAWTGAACARAGATGAAGAAPGATAAAASRAVRPAIDRIGVGLFTVFGELRQDFDGTLARIREIGYREVEFAGYYGRTPEQVKAVLDRVGLTAPSTHIGLDLLRNDLETQLRFAQTLGHRYLTVPSLPRAMSSGRTVEDWKRVAGEFNTLGRTLQQRGVKLAYHNHAGEFIDVGGGKKALDVFVAETDPALVSFEMDLGWARVAGIDPVEWFNRYPGRFTMWHVKDMKGLAELQARQQETFRNPPPPPQGPPAGGPPGGGPPGGQPGGQPPAQVASNGPAPLGQGEVDYRPIFAGWRQSGVEHYFVEHDLAARWPGGAFESLKSSYEYVRRLTT